MKSNKPEFQLKIWHAVHHDGGDVTLIDIETNRLTQLRTIQENGGFWAGEAFIPWHRINYIEVVEKE